MWSNDNVHKEKKELIHAELHCEEDKSTSMEDLDSLECEHQYPSA